MGLGPWDGRSLQFDHNGLGFWIGIRPGEAEGRVDASRVSVIRNADLYLDSATFSGFERGSYAVLLPGLGGIEGRLFHCAEKRFESRESGV